MGEAESVCLSVCSVYCLSRIYCTIIGVLTVLFAVGVGSSDLIGSAAAGTWWVQRPSLSS